MKQITVFLAIFALLQFNCACNSDEGAKGPFLNWAEPSDDDGAQAESGTMPAWQAGYLDIHFINTGTGECSFIIMPDGTQMLVDMASALEAPTGWVICDAKPNASKRASEWIAEYLKKCMVWTSNTKLDYVDLTHFHGDHIGVYSETFPTSSLGNYRLNGVTDILDIFKVGSLVDRGYPNYDYAPVVNQTMSNYIACATYHAANSGMSRDAFVVGSRTQFAMTHNASAYPEFYIENLAVNGSIWNGTTAVDYYPTKEQIAQGAEAPDENHTSSVFRLKYGKFDYYSGGDICTNGMSTAPWKDAETPLANVVGKVEVMKANHHGSVGANSAYFLTTLSPQAIIVNVWNNAQPRKVTFDQMISSDTNYGKTDIFTTNYSAEQVGHAADRILSKQGHIVIRVNPDGEKYYIYSLKDTDMSMLINRRFGPYTCE